MRSKKNFAIVLDDDPAIPRIIEEYLGLSIRSFNTSEELLKQSTQSIPRVVFVDVNIGEKECGLDAIPKLRERWPFCPILVITSDPTDEMVMKALGSGADDFLRKPIHAKELVARVQIRLGDSAEKQAKSEIRILDLLVDKGHQKITGPKGSQYLSSTELLLLLHLIQRRGTVIPKENLKREGWGKIVISDNALVRKIHEIRNALFEVGTRISVHSVYGRGFIIQENQDKRNLASKPNRPKKEALVVDDDDISREVIMEMLKELGILSVGVDNGQDAIELFKENKFKFVFLDFEMPKMSGIETAKELKKIDESIPLIAITASYSMETSKTNSYFLGILSKPFRLEALKNLLSLSLSETTRENQEKPLPTVQGRFNDHIISQLKGLKGKNGQNLYQELLHSFILECPRLLSQIEDSIKRNESNRLKKTAHQLRGRSANLGFTLMEELCGDLERQDKPNLIDVFKMLKSEFQTIQHEFANLKNVA